MDDGFGIHFTLESSVQEFEILRQCLRPLPNAEGVVIGPGDDCSVVEFTQNQYLVTTTDLLVEDVHFRRRTHSVSQLAFKSLAVNISDVAAMGARPQWCHLGLAYPKNFAENHIKTFFSSIYQVLDRWNIQLHGGDLSDSPKSLVISVQMSGVVDKDKIKWRRDLKKEGILCVTGPLGESSAGLYCLQENIQSPLVDRHLKPPVELAKALWLAEYPEVMGMMDLSDGLAGDLQRVSEARFQVELDALPLSQEVKNFCAENNLDPLKFALSGGEDYRLLFNCKSDSLAKLQADFLKHFGEPFHAIGTSSPGSTTEPQITYTKNGKPLAQKFTGYQH